MRCFDASVNLFTIPTSYFTCVLRVQCTSSLYLQIISISAIDIFQKCVILFLVGLRKLSQHMGG